MLDSSITEFDLQYLIKFVEIHAKYQWSYDGQECDINEYIDVGMHAILRCLIRYKNMGVKFRSYARIRIKYEMISALRRYNNWKYRPYEPQDCSNMNMTDIILDTERKATALPLDMRSYIESALCGQNDIEYAKQIGITPVALSLRLRKWRQLT